MPPLVSVIVPCYRQAHFLPDALASVRDQEYATHETIVVDDGSPDDVAAVVARFPGVRCIRQTNRGLSAARNTGIAAATGEYLVCLDSDDRLLPGALRIGVAALTQRPQSAFVWGFRTLIDAQGRPIFEPTDTGYSGSARYDLLLHKNIVGPPVVVMFRRSVLTELGGYDEGQHYSEDYELLLRIARHHDGWCHRQLVAEYRMHGANMSFNLRGMLGGNLRALEAQRAFIGTDRHLRRALRIGRRTAWRDYDAVPRLELFGRQIRARAWLRASASAALLLSRYPLFFLRGLTRKLRSLLQPGAVADSDSLAE